MKEKLNEGWTQGCIGIPGKNTWVKYYVRRDKENMEACIEGSNICGLVLNTETETLAYYTEDSGWVIEPQNEDAEIALQILLLEK